MINLMENTDLLDLLDQEIVGVTVMSQPLCQALDKTQIFIVLKLEAPPQAQGTQLCH